MSMMRTARKKTEWFPLEIEYYDASALLLSSLDAVIVASLDRMYLSLIVRAQEVRTG